MRSEETLCLISVKSDLNYIWYSQHSARAFPLDPEVQGVIWVLDFIVSFISSNTRRVNLERDFKALSVGIVELKQGEEEAGALVCILLVK